VDPKDGFQAKVLYSKGLELTGLGGSGREFEVLRPATYGAVNPRITYGGAFLYPQAPEIFGLPQGAGVPNGPLGFNRVGSVANGFLV